MAVAGGRSLGLWRMWRRVTGVCCRLGGGAESWGASHCGVWSSWEVEEENIFIMPGSNGETLKDGIFADAEGSQ